MSAIVAEAPQIRSEAKIPKKKKAKAIIEQGITGHNSSTTASTKNATSGPTTSSETINGCESKDYTGSYVQELYRSIRNINKKINATAKVDSILAENPDKTLDELVASRKINNDQKAQALKKPTLLISVVVLQEQVGQYKKFDQEYQTRLSSEKTGLEAAHAAELKQVAEETRVETMSRMREEAIKRETANILLLSKCLRLAAAKRQEGEADTDEARALEGLLLMVYGGDSGACEAVQKLLQGVDEKVLSTELQPVNYTYAQVKASAAAFEPYQLPAEEPIEDGAQRYPTSPPPDDAPHVTSAESVVVDAGLSENATVKPAVNGEKEAGQHTTLPPQPIVDSSVASITADQPWEPDTKLSASTEGEGWVEVQHDHAEIETGHSASPAAVTGVQSWADDQPLSAPPTRAPHASQTSANGPTNGPTNGPNDGFHEVHHSRGGRGRGGSHGGERRGNYRGRGGHRGVGEGGAYRGRGGMRGGDRGGEGRGRGPRGGYRGGRGRGEGPQAHPRRADDS